MSRSSTCGSIVFSDLEAHRRAEPAPHELLLEGLEQVLCVVLLDLHVFVAGDAERVVCEDLHAGEEVFEVGRDDVLERDEAHGAHLRESTRGQHRRDLDPGEVLPRRSSGCGRRPPGSATARDVGERVRRVDGERRQHREDAILEELGHPRVRSSSSSSSHGMTSMPSFASAGRTSSWKQRTWRSIRRVRVRADSSSTSRGISPLAARHGDSGDDAALEARDAHHEELVEVAREDGEEGRARAGAGPGPRPVPARAG